MKKLLLKRWAIAILIIIILIVTYIVWNFFYLYDIRMQKKYETEFLDSILSYNKETIDINDVLPFEWDIAYVYHGDIEEVVFNEYTRYSLKDEVSLEPKLSEKFTFLIFIKDNKIVLSLRADRFVITTDEMKTDEIEIFYFTPLKSVFSVSEDKYGKLILTYLE